MRTKKSSKNILRIGDEDFKRKNNIYYNYYNNNFKSLDECYDRPSATKKWIYNKYYDMLLKEKNVEIISYGVKSYNTFMITLEAIIIKNKKRYYLMITPSYNYFMEI